MEELRVLIVDDEYMAVEYLKGLISWEEHGYRIVAEATEVKYALKCFREFHPQIVISDICMPGMNGLEFCKQILSMDHSVKIIFLTAYKEFEYAKKAIELGVSNYLLKHEISEKTLLDELGKARAELEKEQNADRIIKKHVIMNLIEDNEELKEEAGFQWNYLEDRNGMFILVVLSKDAPYPFFEKEKVSLNQDLYEQLKNTYKETQEDFAFIDSFKLRNQTWAVLFTYSGCLSEAALWNRFYLIASKAQETFAKAYKCSFSAAVEMDRQEIRNIAKMYAKLLKLLEYLPFIGKARIVGQYDITGHANRAEAKTEADRILLGVSIALNEQDSDKIAEKLDELFINVVIPDMNPKLLRYCCDELIATANRWREKNFLPLLQNESKEVLARFEDCYTVQDIRLMFQYVFKQSIDKIADLKYAKYSPKIQKAVQYLHKHFSEDITIADVANAVQISDSNLSRTFKSETGISLLEYLTGIRIETAKKLLEEDNLKIYEISEMVGYKTSQYFSQVFVKATGMNPLDYKGGKKFIDKE